MNLESISKAEQPNMISSFWTMLKELESLANNTNDATLSTMVEGWYRQWNTVTGDTKKPRWLK